MKLDIALIGLLLVGGTVWYVMRQKPTTTAPAWYPPMALPPKPEPQPFPPYAYPDQWDKVGAPSKPISRVIEEITIPSIPRSTTQTPTVYPHVGTPSLIMNANPFMDPLADITKPRGIRNNNPFNMKYNPNIQWEGQIGKDSANFVQFGTAEHGIRAGVKNLINGYFNRGINTPVTILERYAPPTDNNPNNAQYAQLIARTVGVAVDGAIVPNRSNLIKLSKAIIMFENGQQPYPDTTIERGVDMAMA